MNIRKIEYPKINEILYEYTHSSGLKAYVIPKKGYYKKFAAFGTNYGSIDSEFIAPGEKESVKVPDGIAHFLEHKLFEQKDGNVMDKYTAIGASPNAFTSFNQTVYLFSCTENFREGFDL
jgi:predicted Zn-dependent peptidase